MLLCHIIAYFNMAISSANATKLKYKQPTKLSTNGCIQIILQPLYLRTVQIKPIVKDLSPSDRDTNGKRENHSCMCQAYAVVRHSYVEGYAVLQTKETKQKVKGLNQCWEGAMGTQGLNFS